MYPVAIQKGDVYIMVPDDSSEDHSHDFSSPEAAPAPRRELAANEFHVSDVGPGQMKLVFSGAESVAVYRVGDNYFATESLCPHMGGELTEGFLEGDVIRCPIHSSRFRVEDGSNVSGPARRPLKTFRVILEGEIGRVEA
jgi:nitrite reductase/ring-hydroxylating ferredoxin subunit